MDLPGGSIFLSSEKRAPVSLSDINGEMELELWEAVNRPILRNDIICHLLDYLFDLGEHGEARNLCEADHVYLLSKALFHQGFETKWITGTCQHCSALFDVSLNLSNLPLKPKANSYPRFEFEFENIKYTGRIPSIADINSANELADYDLAIKKMVRLCLDNDVPEDNALERLLPLINQAIEEIVPEIATSIEVNCPDCGKQNSIFLDLGSYCTNNLSNPLEDIHELASHYHWHEQDILQLPKARRQAYLDLIDAQKRH